MMEVIQNMKQVKIMAVVEHLHVGIMLQLICRVLINMLLSVPTG